MPPQNSDSDFDPATQLFPKRQKFSPPPPPVPLIPRNFPEQLTEAVAPVAPVPSTSAVPVDYPTQQASPTNPAPTQNQFVRAESVQNIPQNNFPPAQPSSPWPESKFRTPEKPFIVSPQQPVNPPPPSRVYVNQPKKSHIGLILFIILILGLLGGSAYAYNEKLWFFAKPPYDTSKLASSIFAGVGKIRTSSYALHLKVASEPREADAVPFTAVVSPNNGTAEAYKRDQDKVRDIQVILQALQSSFSRNKVYPRSLDSLGKEYSFKRNAYTYVPTTNSTNFALTAVFETSDAISKISSSLKTPSGAESAVDGKSITFTKTSPTYIYLPASQSTVGLFSVGNAQQYLAYIPANFLLDASLSGASQKVDDNNINGKLAIIGKVEMNDIDIAVDTEFRKVADNIYILINKFPSIFFDITKLKGKWITITPADMASYGSSIFRSSPKSAQEQITKAREQGVNRLKLFLTVADKHHALVVVGKPINEKVGSISAYRYELQLNKATLVEFYTDLAAESKKEWGEKDGIVVSQSLIDYLKSPEFDQVFDYLRKNTTLTVWADSEGIPVQAKYSVRIVPDSSTNSTAKNNNNQVRATVILTLSDINQSIVVDAPTDSLSIEDATIAITGQSKEQYQYTKQISVVTSIRNALQNYYQVTGVYPVTLEELKKTRGELKKQYPQSSKNQLSSFYGDDVPILAEIPTDPVSKLPFTYSLKGKDYNLTYTVKLPVYQPRTSARGSYSYNYSAAGSYTTKVPIVIPAVTGKNTADSKVISQEAALQSQLDTDRDGVPDVLETYLGTNKLKADSDGDGSSDYDEIIRDSNPLGPGNLDNATIYPGVI